MADKPVIPAGQWRSRGYGWVLDADDDGFRMHDLTAVSSAVCDRGGPGDTDTAFEVREQQGDRLVLRHRGDVTDYWFDRLPALPDICGRPDIRHRDAARNFDVLCRLFEEHYAFFDLCGVDWQDARRRLGAHITPATTPEELLDIAGELIAPLQDTHVSIDTGDRILDVTSPIRERKHILRSAFGMPDQNITRQIYTDRFQVGLGDMFLDGRYRATTNRLMIYGEIRPGIGYLTMFGEYGHADTVRSRAAATLPRERVEAASFLADEIAAINKSLDEVTAAMAGMKALIVDARFNFGGYDRLALEFAGRFTDRRRPAYHKKAWTTNGFVGEQTILVEPRSPSLAHMPVHLLTSRQTASAGEILVLAMMACPNVTRVGEATLGILSDNLYKLLPNGWEVSLSNEVYETPDGKLYERIGIPTEIETVVFDPSDVRGGVRVAVDRALELIRSRA